MKIPIFPGKYHQEEGIFHGYVTLQECKEFLRDHGGLLSSHDFEVVGTCHTLMGPPKICLMNVGFPGGEISHLQLGISAPYRRIEFWIPKRKLRAKLIVHGFPKKSYGEKYRTSPFSIGNMGCQMYSSEVS